MKPTIYTVAEEAGVSIATVSRAFNNHPRISEETKRKIFGIADALGYYPSATARNLANSTTETLGLVLPRPSDPFFSEFIRGAEEVSKANQYHLLIYTSQNLDEEDAFLSFLPARIDGLVLASYGSTGQYVRRLHSQRFPFVLIGSAHPDLVTDTVRPDNQVGAHLLTKHLIEQHGYEKIAFICGPDDQKHSAERLSGYRQALQEHDIPWREDWIVHGDFNEASGYACAQQLLQLPDPPRAIFAGNDWMAIGAMAAANDCGKTIPTEVAVVGFDDVPSARYLQPALTTISVATYEQGRRAVEQLLVRISNPDAPRMDIVIPAPVILRRSCGCTAEQT